MFLKNLIKKAKTVVDTTEEIDNHFFAQVMEEIEKGFKDKGINGKAIALSAGDEAKANSIYIELRAKALQNKFGKEQEEKNKKLKEEMERKALKEKKEKELEEENFNKISNIIQGKLSSHGRFYFYDLYKDEPELEGFIKTGRFSLYDLKKGSNSYDIRIKAHEHIMQIVGDSPTVPLIFNLEDKIDDIVS